MIRSRDLVRKCEKYISLLKTYDPTSHLFRYILTDIIVTFRNISWVLQKDLYTLYKAQFEKWWEVNKDRFQSDNIPFGKLRDFRNQIVKEGGPYPITVTQLHLKKSKYLKSITFNLDLSSFEKATDSVIMIKFEFKKNTRIENKAKVEKDITKIASDFIELIIRDKNNLKLKNNVIKEFHGYQFWDEGPVLKKPEILGLLTETTKHFNAILLEAEKKFPIKSAYEKMFTRSD